MGEFDAVVPAGHVVYQPAVIAHKQSQLSVAGVIEKYEKSWVSYMCNI